MKMQDRTEKQKEVMTWDWVISVMDSDTADFVIQSNTPYIGRREMKMMDDANLEQVAISSHGSNGQLRIHVRE